MGQEWKINKETKAATRWENGGRFFLHLYKKRGDENAQ